MITIKPKLAPAWFEFKKDDPTAEAFLLAPLNKFDAVDFYREVIFRKGKLTVTGEGVRIAARCIRDWRNVVDEKGAPVQFDASLVEDLPTHTLITIAAEVFNRTFLSEAERKNSSSPSTLG
jgi:hypothetical protein